MRVGADRYVLHAVEIVIADVNRALLVIQQSHVDSRLPALIKLHISIRYIDDLVRTGRPFLVERVRGLARTFGIAARFENDLDIEIA